MNQPYTTMSLPINKKHISVRQRALAVDLMHILFGAFLQALAYSAFIAPNNIVPGGIYGITIVLNYVTKGTFAFAPDGLPIGITALFFNVPLVILAARKLGLSSLWKTIITFVLISLFTDALGAYFLHHPLAPNDKILSAFYGGAILGFGVFLIFKTGGTSAGTDVLARVIAKGSNMKLSNVIVVVDSIIVLIGLLTFRDWAVPLYSWLTIFVYGQVVGFLQPENPKKAVFIVSAQVDEIKEMILHELKLRGTVIKGKGMYQSVDREILFLITERKVLPQLKKRVLEIDGKAFVSTMDASHDPSEVIVEA